MWKRVFWNLRMKTSIYKKEPKIIRSLPMKSVCIPNISSHTTNNTHGNFATSCCERFAIFTKEYLARFKIVIHWITIGPTTNLCFIIISSKSAAASKAVIAVFLSAIKPVLIPSRTIVDYLIILRIFLFCCLGSRQ